MEWMLLLALAVVWGTTPIWAFIWLKKLSNKVDEQARELELIQLKGGTKKQKTSASEQFAQMAAKEAREKSLTEEHEEHEEYTQEEKEPFKWEEFFTKKFFTILGVTSIVLAIGFFMAWSFANGWIGPTGRTAIGVITSLAFLVGGELLRNKYEKFYSALSSVGIAGLVITTYFARQAYGFITPGQSFILYVLEVGAGLFLSLRYQSRLLGNFSILGGLIAPVIAGVEPNQYGLLVYLAVLSVAGFVVSIRQKWPEIIAVLLVGVSIFENMILGFSRPTYEYSEALQKSVIASPGWMRANAFGFLGLTYFMHLLFGSGSIIRMVREKKSQLLGKPVELNSGMGILLLILSTIIANGIAYEVFQIMEWKYFGFFVLAQGFGFYFLGDYLKSKKLEIFHKIALGGTLISIFFATAWEIESNKELLKGSAFLLEGILFAYVGQQLKEKWFTFFGRIGLLIGSFYIFQVNEILGFVLILLYFGGLILTLRDFSQTWEKILGILGYLWGVLALFAWNHDVINDLVKTPWEMLNFVLPIVVALATGYRMIVPSVKASRILGLIIIAFTALFFWIEVGSWGRDYWFIYLVSLLVMLASLFGVLASFFWEKDGEEVISPQLKLFSIYGILALTTLSVLVWSFELAVEPFKTLSLVGWGALLMGVGIHQDWTRFRYFGIGMILFVIAKIYIVDVWDWSTPIRFGAFLILGITLLSLSFFSQKFISKK